MTISTTDGLISAFASKSQVSELYANSTVVTTGALSRITPSSWGTIATPSAFALGGDIPTNSTAGFPGYTNPTGGDSAYIAGCSAVLGQPGQLALYDLCWFTSGFLGNINTAQSVLSFPTLTRPGSTGEGLQLWLMGGTAIGASAANVTVQYTNSAGTGSRNTASEAIIASLASPRLQRLSLQSGDTGVQSVQSLTLSASTGTAGNLWLGLLRPLGVTVSTAFANIGVTANFADVYMPPIGSSAALFAVHLSTTTSTGTILASYPIIRG